VPWNKDALLFDGILDVEARPERVVRPPARQGVRSSTSGLLPICADQTGRLGVRRFSAAARRHISADLRPHHLIAAPDHYSCGRRRHAAADLYFTAPPSPCPAPSPSRIRTGRARRGAALLRAILRRHPRRRDRGVRRAVHDPAATIEGGVLVVDASAVVVGVGERTNEAGAEHLARFLFERTAVERVVKVRVPAKREFMHLDTVLTFVDRGRILTMPYLRDRPELYAAIAARSRRQCEELASRTPAGPETLLDASRLDVVRAAATAGATRPPWTVAPRPDRAASRSVAGRRGQHPSPGPSSRRCASSGTTANSLAPSPAR
jgi:hypothetical protein